MKSELVLLMLKAQYIDNVLEVHHFDGSSVLCSTHILCYVNQRNESSLEQKKSHSYSQSNTVSWMNDNK